jgi:hypothetical protein
MLAYNYCLFKQWINEFLSFFLKKLELAIEELTVIAQDLFDHYRIV